MFLVIKLRDKEGVYFEHINVTHITRLSIINASNPDAGSKIHLRTGEVLTSSSPIDVLTSDIDDCWKSAISLIMFNIIAEKSKIISASSSEESIEVSSVSLPNQSEI